MHRVQISSLSASTITRITGSVPDSRTRTRPSSPSASSASRMAAQTAGSCRTAALSRTRTLTSTCGKTGIAAASSLTGVPWCANSTSMTLRLVRSPSPVVASRRKMMCPDCSPPIASPNCAMRS